MEVREGGRLTSRMILVMDIKWAIKYPALKIPGYRLSGRQISKRFQLLDLTYRIFGYTGRIPAIRQDIGSKKQIWYTATLEGNISEIL